MLEYVAAAGVGAALTGLVVALKRAASRYLRHTLPPPAGPPESRGEAVRRVLEHLQRRTIGELREGEAAVVVGVVHAVPGVAPLRAPYSGQQCLGYHLDVQNIMLEPWFSVYPVHESAVAVAFDVTDDTGTIRVVPDGLELAITDGTPVSLNQIPAQLAPLLPRGLSGYQLTVEEGLLHAGARILVCGIATREQLATDYRDGATALVLRASATFPLVASTDANLLTPGERPIAPEELRRRR